ncbi:MAG: Thiol-disulfide oxidoreductase ResA [Planctomycetota bacterium]|jgi:thiol-disulfide isomerase/thioredoxin
MIHFLPSRFIGILMQCRAFSGAVLGPILIALYLTIASGILVAQEDSKPIPLTNEEFQARVKNKNLGPFVAELDRAVAKTPNEPSILGLELQVAQLLLVNDRAKGMERFRGWIDKLSKLPRSSGNDKLFVAGVFNASAIQDPLLAREFISWIDSAIDRIPPAEAITKANLTGNRLSLQSLIEDKDELETEFSRFFSGLETLESEKKIPVSVLASQAMRYKSIFWNTHREQSLKNLEKSRTAYKQFFKQGTTTPTDVLVYIQFMTTFANEITKEIPRESYSVLTELKDQLIAVRTQFPDDQKKSLETTIKSIEQGLKQLDLAIRQIELIGTQAPSIAEAQFKDVPEVMQAELRNKITLLVFWAAWSEPSLKSLSRVDKIREDYKDKDVVVIGVTKWYGMVWDEETKTATRLEEVSHDQELNALKAIAEFHGTKMGHAVVPEESKVFDNYVVSGIPQLVLIGSDGIIKAIRPGLNETHFKSIENELHNLTSK